MKNYFGLLAAALLLVACASLNVSGEPPSPPAQAQSQTVYLAPDEIDMTHLLPPPPTPGSKDERAELDEMLALQKSRTADRTALAVADAEVNLTRFSSVLGPSFKPEALPRLNAFLQNVGRSTGPYIGITKDCWVRLRPFVAEPKLAPPSNMKASTGAREGAPRAKVPLGPGSPCLADAPESQYSFAYPSGHATWGWMNAILLAEMLPEKRDALFARGRQYGESRIVGSVHFPSDVEAGRTQATVLVALMMENAEFRSDLAAARAELRGALGLPQ